MRGEPVLEVGEFKGVETFFIDIGKLSNEGEYGVVGEGVLRCA